VLWFGLTASPVPSPSPGFDENLVTPGVWGFAITFAVMVAVILLIVDMTRRIRRVTYRAQVKEQLEAEAAAAAGADPEQQPEPEPKPKPKP
jgi:hypothetical protein